MADILSGKIGKAQVNGTDLDITEWSFDPQADELDAGHTGGAGFANYEAGLKRATFQISANWDADAHPTSSPPALIPGTKLTNVHLYLGDPADDNKVVMASALITGLPISSSVGELVTWQYNGRSNGAYVLPS